MSKLDLASIARYLIDQAYYEENDIKSNNMARLGSALVDYGQPFGPRNMDELSERAGVSKHVIKQLMQEAQLEQ